MSAYFNDPQYLADLDSQAMASPSEGPPLGAWHQAGLGLMRGGVQAVDAARMAVAVPVAAFSDDETQDAYFRQTDDVIKSALNYWTPDPASTTMAGRAMGGVAEAILPMMVGGGSPAPLMVSAQTRTSRSLVDQGVDASTARDVGMVDALAVGAGFMIPIFGKTLASRLTANALINPVIGAATTAVQQGALAEAGQHQAAQQYDPLDLESRGVDVAMGVLFGGLAHVTGAHSPQLGLQHPGEVVAAALDDILTYRGAQRWDRGAIGDPATLGPRNVHDTNMRSAIESMIRGEEVSVPRTDMGAPPDLSDSQAAARAIVDKVFSDQGVTSPDSALTVPDAAAPVAQAVRAVDRLPTALPAVVEQALTRAEAAAARYAKESRVNPVVDDLLAAIAKEGGISREAAAAAGIDPAEFKRRGWRIKPVFTAKGLGLEAMSERLAAHGYPVSDAGGYGENPMLGALDRALRGESVRTMAGMESAIQAEATARDLPGHEAPMLADHEYAALDTPNQQQIFDAAERARDAGVHPDDIQTITELGGVHGYDTQEIIRLLDEEAAQRGRAAGGATTAKEQPGGPRAGEGAPESKPAPPAGDDIIPELVEDARDVAAADPDTPILMPDDITDRPALVALADAERAVTEAEGTFARAAKAAARCLIG